MSDVQTTVTAPSTNGAELATQQTAMIDPFEAFRVQMGKTLATPMTKIVEVSMGGWAALHGKTAGDRVADATCRMIGGDLASMMIAETRNSIAGKLFAQATAESSIIGKSGTYKSDAEWLARVNAALPVGEDGKRSAYTLGTMRLYAKLYAKSESWAKTYNLQFGKDDGLYRSLGTTVCNRLAELESGGGLDKDEFGKLIELCRNGGTVKIGDKEETVPAAAPRSAKSVDVCYAALADSLGKALTLPKEKTSGKRQPAGETDQNAASAVTQESESAPGIASSESIEANVKTVDVFTKLAKSANDSLTVAMTFFGKCAATYIQTKAEGDVTALTILEQEFAKVATNPFADSLWKSAKLEATRAYDLRKAKLDSAAIAAVIDASKAGTDIPESITWDNTPVTITDAHRKTAAVEVEKWKQASKTAANQNATNAVKK